MTPPTAHLPLQGIMAGFHRFTVDEYHRLIEIGIITENDNLELIEGYVVQKMGKNPPHSCSLGLTTKLLNRLIPANWIVRVQDPITLSDSEPEPDLAVARGDARTFATHHPRPSDIGVVIEVADSSLAYDRADKTRIYGRAGIVCYWIINLVDAQIEVYTSPSGSTASPGYAQRQDYRPGDAVPFLLDGALIANIPVQELLP
jgi:hypothetical protein